jgi:hypothetical protein
MDEIDAPGYGGGEPDTIIGSEDIVVHGFGMAMTGILLVQSFRKLSVSSPPMGMMDRSEGLKVSERVGSNP